MYGYGKDMSLAAAMKYDDFVSYSLMIIANSKLYTFYCRCNYGI